MKPHLTYQRTAAAGWTRVDLLLTVYDIGIQTAYGAIQAIDQRNGDALTRHRLKFYRVLLQILDGLDDRYEMSRDIRRLTMFLFDRSNVGQSHDWQTIITILQTVRDGFASIRDQAAELEEQGMIPATHTGPAAVNVSV